MLVVGIIIAVLLFMVVLCNFAIYSIVLNILSQIKTQNELFKKLLRK